MKHLDLGELPGPVMVFGGVYSNFHALEALCGQATARNIGPDHMICTGDIVAYCGSPRESVARMRDLGCPVLAGNCEIQLGEDAPDCGCGFEEGTACDLLSVGWYGHARAALSQDDKEWLAKHPDIISFYHEGSRYAVIHGGLTDVARFIWVTSPPDVFQQEWDAIQRAIGPVDQVIAGHCGLPFTRNLGYGRWINPGVIGMPPHDGERTTRFMILEGEHQSFHALSYDADGAAEAMAQVPTLGDAYRAALLSGYWPSEDVLPSDLRVLLSARG